MKVKVWFKSWKSSCFGHHIKEKLTGVPLSVHVKSALVSRLNTTHILFFMQVRLRPFAGIHVLYMLTLFNRLIRNCTKSCNRLLNLLSWQPWLFTVSSDMKISFWWNWFIFFSNSLHSVWLCGAWRQCLTSTTTTRSPTCILYTAGVVLPQ